MSFYSYKKDTMSIDGKRVGTCSKCFTEDVEVYYVNIYTAFYDKNRKHIEGIWRNEQDRTCLKCYLKRKKKIQEEDDYNEMFTVL